MELRYCEECGDVVQVETNQAQSLSDHFLCDSCRSGPKGEARKGEERDLSMNTVLKGTNLDLFSQNTIALKKKQYQEELSSKKPKSTRLRLVKPSSPTGDPGEAPAPAGEGCTSPAKSARKILFRCLHCRSTLSIRPVDRTSKLTCPQCGKPIYVTASGQLLKTSPSLRIEHGGFRDEAGRPGSGAARKPGSVAVPKPGSAAVPRVGSAGVPKQKSGAVPKASTAVAKGSAAVKKSGSQIGPKPKSFRMIEAKGNEAAPALLEKRAGSNRVVKLAGQAPSTGPAEAGVSRVKLTDVNPAGGWSPRPTSAFAEHQAKQDPEKTAFITDEVTGDFSDVAPGGKSAVSKERASLPRLAEQSRPPSDALGSLLPDESDLMEEGNDFASAAAKSFDRDSLFRRQAKGGKKETKGAEGRSGGLPQRLAKAFLLALCLSAPMAVACGLFTREAAAKGAGAAPGSSASFLEGLGNRATQGIHRLLYWIGRAEHR